MKAALEAAFDSGYRLIDTAYAYRNESLIGEALKEIFDSGKIKREEVFVTTKVIVLIFLQNIIFNGMLA